MKQPRVRSGELFENTFNGTEWEVVRVSPKIYWSGKGRDNLRKIRSADFNENEFYPLDKSTWNKYDLKNKVDGRKREAKKYKISKLTNWTLYSEPYFKVSTRNQLSRIDKEDYNDFLGRFYQLHKSDGLFDDIINKMTNSCEGIQFEDGFVPMDKIEFITMLSTTEWAGYNRIQIQFKLK